MRGLECAARNRGAGGRIGGFLAPLPHARSLVSPPSPSLPSRMRRSHCRGASSREARRGRPASIHRRLRNRNEPECPPVGSSPSARRSGRVGGAASEPGPKSRGGGQFRGADERTSTALAGAPVRARHRARRSACACIEFDTARAWPSQSDSGAPAPRQRAQTRKTTRTSAVRARLPGTQGAIRPRKFAAWSRRHSRESLGGRPRAKCAKSVATTPTRRRVGELRALCSGGRFGCADEHTSAAPRVGEGQDSEPESGGPDERKSAAFREPRHVRARGETWPRQRSRERPNVWDGYESAVVAGRVGSGRIGGAVDCKPAGELERGTRSGALRETGARTLTLELEPAAFARDCLVRANTAC
ncbi:hypothetical protein B0H10DRAFT_1135206 [Mycena sp. CBHHK59/15]|nr:hypothetical protein B0H10DRAFT_1135206 [Mycena sp. CBHHK59/15]